jgi:CRISPR-associated protein Cas1
VLLDRNGRFKARLEGPVSGNVLLRQAQHEPGRRSAFALEVARSCVAGKIRNARQVLLSAAPANRRIGKDASRACPRRRRSGRRTARIARCRVISTPCAASKAKRRASTSRALNLLVRPMRAKFSRWMGAPGAHRATAQCAPVLSLLDVDERLPLGLEAAGLIRRSAFLHAVRPGRAALALDLMEEFRPFADRLALTLINRATSVRGLR